jgi:hypothetical protein
MSAHTLGILRRAAFYSFLSGLAAAFIYMVIDLVTGGKLDGNALLGSLITGLISFMIAIVFFVSFTLFFFKARSVVALAFRSFDHH